MKPLHAPAILDIDASQPEGERFWGRLPIIGTMVADRSWTERARPIVQQVEEQLRQRPRPSPEVWGADPLRIELGTLLAQVAKEAMSWPNDHFIPEDPAYVVFWAHTDGLDFEEALLTIEERLQSRLPPHEVASWFQHTLGEVVEFLVEHLKAGSTAR